MLNSIPSVEEARIGNQGSKLTLGEGRKGEGSQHSFPSLPVGAAQAVKHWALGCLIHTLTALDSQSAFRDSELEKTGQGSGLVDPQGQQVNTQCFLNYTESTKD